MGGQAVAPGAAGLLVIAFDVLGHVQVRHKTHIGLVNAHAKRNGGHHHNALFAQKPVLVPLPNARIHPRVIGQGQQAMLHQGLRHLLDTLA